MINRKNTSQRERDESLYESTEEMFQQSLPNQIDNLMLPQPSFQKQEVFRKNLSAASYV